MRILKSKKEGEIIRLFDPWDSPLCTCPFKYTLNPYTGCSFFCVYCYATAYIGRRKSTPKKNYLERLLKDLRKIDKRLPINMSTSTDPYPPVEEKMLLTRTTLQILSKHDLRVLITTKGTLYTRDIDIIRASLMAVTPTITTINKGISSKIEPYAPLPSERINALNVLEENNVPFGVRIDPILPYINDDPKEIEELVSILSTYRNLDFIVTSTFKARPDSLSRVIEVFPELETRYKRLYREEGKWMHGYWYLPQKMRLKLLKPVFESARKYGIKYAHCREGFAGKEYFTAASCDGTHLLYPPYR